MSLSTFSDKLAEIGKCRDHPPLRQSQSMEEAESWAKVIQESCSPVAAKQHLRWFARNDLYFLMTQLLRRPDRKSLWDFERCREVQAEPHGHMDFWSRGSGKSTIISWALPIQKALTFPNTSAAWFSHTRPIARSFLQLVKREFEENAELIRLFPDILWEDPKIQSPKWSEVEGLILKRTINRPESTFEAWGLIEGLPTRKHYDDRYYDDIITERHVTNPEQVRRATEQFFLSQALSTRERSLSIVGVYYAEDDPYQQIEDVGVYRPRIRPSGYEGIYAPGLSPEELHAIEKVTLPHIYAYQYAMDRERAKENREVGFREEWLLWEEEAPPLGSMSVYLVVDPAGGRPTSSSKTAMWVIGVTSDKRKHVFDGCCLDLDLPGRWEKVKGFVLKYYQYLKGVIYESYSMQSDSQYIEEKRKELNLSFTLLLVGGFNKKERRIDLLYSPLALHHYSFLKEIWQETPKGKENIVSRFLEYEYTKYPHTTTCDQLDCLSRMEDPTIVPRLVYPQAYGQGSAASTGPIGELLGGASWMSQ